MKTEEQIKEKIECTKKNIKNYCNEFKNGKISKDV